MAEGEGAFGITSVVTPDEDRDLFFDDLSTYDLEEGRFGAVVLDTASSSRGTVAIRGTEEGVTSFKRGAEISLLAKDDKTARLPSSPWGGTNLKKQRKKIRNIRATVQTNG